MDRFQNVRHVASPPNTSFEQSSSTIVTRRGIEPTRLFYESGVRQ